MNQANSPPRYARQLALPGFTPAIQQNLTRARVLLIGLGGLGAPAALYLAGAGVGELLLCDFDTVDITNLHRQPLYRTADINMRKTTAAAAALGALNPDIKLTELPRRLTADELPAVVAGADVVVDASDNFGTRFALNAASRATGTPLVSGAALRFEGHVTVFDPRRADSPCYACLYAEDAEGLEDCRGNGVLGPVPGVIGSLQAVEALKLLTGLGTPLVGQLLIYNAQHGSFRSTRIARDPACPVCAVQNHHAES